MSQPRAKRKKAKLKKVSFKDKDWFEVIAPKNFNFKFIGEIIGLDNIQGRTIETLLYDFSNNYNDINLKLKFKVVKVNNEAKKCDTIFIGHQYTNDYVRSLVGRGSTKIAIIQNLTTMDGFVFRVTTICTTIQRARSSQQIVIRKIMMDILKEFAIGLNHEKFVIGMIYGEFQNQVARVAKSIYPLSSCTVIKSKLISRPEGAEDKEVSKDESFEIVEVDVKRSRKSEIKRTERINVKKLSRNRPSTEKTAPKTATKTENETKEKSKEVKSKEEKPKEEKPKEVKSKEVKSKEVKSKE